ncbi:MAG: cytidylyltransferase domain-containing protein, partial [Maricaulaceae bacterium]
MTVAAIVQARWGSSRLPGKTLERIGSKTALAWCLDRCAAIPGVDVVVCAVPDTAINDPVAEEAARGGHQVTRGSEDDVLARYVAAARQVEAQTVMRITSDCPFIDPAIAGRVLALSAEAGVDYACNNMPPAFPHGLDCDAFDAELLYEADALAWDRYDREHVTPYIRRHAHITRASLTGPGGVFADLRWTLDYEEDLAFFRAVADALGPKAETATAAEIAALCLRRPDLVAIKAERANPDRM